MGGALKSITKPLAIAANPMIGLNALAGKKGAEALGIKMDDEQGDYLTPEQKAQRDAQAYYGNYDKAMGDATKGVQEGALTKGLFGAGGLQEQLGNEQKDLSSRGYELTQGDREAYGQTAGDVSRMFGQQNQAATAQLARRGLGSGASGAAGATFSGLQGNKNEMLARAQTDIAQKRMADTNQRLQQTRAQMQSLTNQGTGLANQGWANKGESLDKAAGREIGLHNQNQQTLEAQQAAMKPGLFSTLGQGLQRGIGQMAQAAPGMALGAATGGGSLVASGGAGMLGDGGGNSAIGAPNKTMSGQNSRNYGNYA
jgi:hypothetical protein